MKSPREAVEKLLNMRCEYVDMKTGRSEDVKEDTTCIVCGFPLSKIRREKMIDKALSDLAEILRGEMKEITPPWGDDVTLEKAQQIYDKQLAERIYNQAITDIAKLFEKGER